MPREASNPSAGSIDRRDARYRRVALWVVAISALGALVGFGTPSTAAAEPGTATAINATGTIDDDQSSDPVKLTDARAAEMAAGPVRLAIGDTADQSTDAKSYIVRFVAGSNVRRETEDLASAGIDVNATYDAAFPGAVVEASPSEAAAIRRDPAVASVIADQVLELNDPEQSASSVQSIQAAATWGLDRSDQRNLPLSGTYGYDHTGAGVDVYVLDTGIRADHAEFGGRVLPGAYTIDDEYLTEDCNGHGTHVSGTVGSATYGIAKGVWLIPVRVLSCAGSGSTSGVIAGINWVIQRHTPGVPAVLNMSIGGPGDSNLDTAVQAAVNDGITVVVAAGNEGDLACGYSPARAPSAITVAATNSSDYSPDWSNWGSCVDVFAPGSSITSTWHTSSTAFNTISGTSMATPHVAGAAALLLQQHPDLTPAQVSEQLISAATSGLVRNGGSTSPNLLLYVSTEPQPPPPANDNLAAATPLSTDEGAHIGTNISATKESGEPDHADSAGGRSVWWTFAAPADGTLTVSTDGSSFDTTLAAYTGASIATLTGVASNDDHETDLWSELSFTAVAGTTYRIAVDGYGGLSGAITLQTSWQPAEPPLTMPSSTVPPSTSPPSTSPPSTSPPSTSPVVDTPPADTPTSDTTPPTTPSTSPPTTAPPATTPPSSPPADVGDTGYEGLEPARLADTRAGMPTVDGASAGTGKVTAGEVLELQVTGRAGIPADATAVVLNVAATEAEGAGFMTAFPCGTTRPHGSSLNYEAGSTVANAVISKIGTGGRVCLFTLAGAHVVVDVNGYFPAGSSFAPLVPARLMDTRPGAATIDSESAGSGALAGGSVTPVRVTGRSGVPGTAAAVALNVTVTEPSGAGYVTVFPCGAAVPNGSSLNFVHGSTVANAVISKVGSGGSVCVYASAGTHVIADLNGYFPTGSTFTSLVPARLLETRTGLSTIDGSSNSIGRRSAGSTIELSVAGRAGVPADASAVVLNVTVTAPGTAGYVTVFPCGSTRPNAANLNFAAGSTTANAVVAKVGAGGAVCLFTSADTHVIVDINGFFTGG